MTEYQHTRSLTRLWVVGILGLAYGVVFALRPDLLGKPLLAGSIGVLLGLFISSVPAANAIDYFLFGRVGRYGRYSAQSETVWFIANCLVLLIGLIVVIIGATRFSTPTL